jgi:hypothetical protein
MGAISLDQYRDSLFGIFRILTRRPRDPAQLWQFYILLVEIEAAFKNLKDDLALRPIFHQLERRIEAHIFVAFMAYCLHVTLRARLRPLAPGLTHVPFWTSLPPSRCSMCTSQRPTAGL